MTQYKIYRVRGDHMVAGYREDFASHRFQIAVRDGQIFECDPDGYPDFRDPPLVLDADGMIIRREAVPGYGFLPDNGEVERLEKAGVVFLRI